MITKIKDVAVRNATFNLCRVFMYVQLQLEEEPQLLYNRIIACAKQAWERGGVILQEFAAYFSMHYFSIIGNIQSL